MFSPDMRSEEDLDPEDIVDERGDEEEDEEEEEGANKGGLRRMITGLNIGNNGERGGR